MDERLEGTAATVAAAIVQGADIVRVHDVLAMTRVARMMDAMVRPNSTLKAEARRQSSPTVQGMNTAESVRSVLHRREVVVSAGMVALLAALLGDRPEWW